MSPSRILARIAVVFATAALGLVTVPAAPAYAHASLVATSPARNAVVAAAPAEVVLTFSESVGVVPDRIKVMDPGGARADVGPPAARDRTVRIALRPTMPRGTYVVSYRVKSADNHPLGGSFSFSVGAPSATGSTGTSDTAASAGGTVAVAFSIVRGVGYAGLALLVGAAVVLTLLWPRRLDRHAALRVLWTGAAVVALTAVLEVLLEVWYLSGALADVGWSQVRDVMVSQYGAAHAVRLGVALGAPLLLHPLINGGRKRSDAIIAVVVAVLGLATWPTSGHPAASPLPALSLVADLTHLAAMSVWLGGLALLAAVLLPKADATELAGIVPVWSRWAQLTVGALLVTGIVQSLIEVGSVGALFATTYGWLLVAKVGLLVGVLALAWQSRRLVPLIAARTDRAAARLRGLVAAEAAGIAIVLAVASVLVQTPPARGAATPPGPGSAVEQSVVLANELYRLSVRVLPVTVGVNDVHVYAYNPDGRPADVKEWRATAAPSNQDIEPLRLRLLPITADHAMGQANLPSAGRWRFTFTLRLTEIDQASVTATFDVTTG